MLPGRTWGAIRNKWCRQVAPRDESGELVHANPRYFTSEDYCKMHEMRQAGVGFPQIVEVQFPTRTTQEVTFAYNAYLTDGAPKRKRSHRWTKAEEERGIHLSDVKGYSLGQVAAALGRRQGSVRSKFKRARPTGRQDRGAFSAEENATIVRLSIEGRPIEDCEAALPLRSRGSIKNRKRRLRMTAVLASRGSSQQVTSLYDRIMVMKQEALNSAAIAETLGISQRQLYAIIDRRKPSKVESVQPVAHMQDESHRSGTPPELPPSDLEDMKHEDNVS